MVELEVERAVRYFPVPVGLTAAASATDDDAPVPARPASTVMVVRDAQAGGDGVEVFMLRRRSSMAFAPNRMVFPGGGVDARDGDDDLPWAGPSPAEWAEPLRARDETEARELVVAAAREVFEECGVLLAGPEGSLVDDLSEPRWHAERDRLTSRGQSFSEMLIRLGFVLCTDLLRPWAHWVTPEFERRRYDTRFFVAVLPEGQMPDDRTTEADTADWVRPADLLADAQAGHAALLPPTVVCLEQLAAATDAGDVLDSPPPMLRVMPTLESQGDAARLRIEIPVRSEKR